VAKGESRTSVSPCSRDDIARLCQKAQETPSAQPNFLTKRLNVWVNADSPWMDMRAWDRARIPRSRSSSSSGEPCIAGGTSTAGSCSPAAGGALVSVAWTLVAVGSALALVGYLSTRGKG
jgi:hypothetical protein